VAKAQRVDEIVGEIANASREQDQGISQVNGAVSAMDKLTQSNAAAAEESAGAAEELYAQAAMMNDSVHQLHALVGAANADTSPVAAPVAPRAPSSRPAAIPSAQLRKPLLRPAAPARTALKDMNFV